MPHQHSGRHLAGGADRLGTSSGGRDWLAGEVESRPGPTSLSGGVSSSAVRDRTAWRRAACGASAYVACVNAATWSPQGVGGCA